MKDTYTVPSGATATAGSQPPLEPGMMSGARHVLPPSADLAKPMRRAPGDWQIQAAYTSWRQLASSTSASFGAHVLPLMSVAGPTVTCPAKPEAALVAAVPPEAVAECGAAAGEQATAAVARAKAAATARYGTLTTKPPILPAKSRRIPYAHHACNAKNHHIRF